MRIKMMEQLKSYGIIALIIIRKDIYSLHILKIQLKLRRKTSWEYYQVMHMQYYKWRLLKIIMEYLAIS